MTHILIVLAAFVATILITQGFLIMAKLDTASSQVTDLITAFDAETNAIAARIDAFEIAVGSTVTQDQINHLRAISDRLKSLGAETANPVPTVPAKEAEKRALDAALLGAPCLVEAAHDCPDAPAVLAESAPTDLREEALKFSAPARAAVDESPIAGDMALKRPSKAPKG